jgi:pilus assembly protein CpaF
MNTGHEGSLATVHANSAMDALSRLETLATMSDIEVPFAAIRDQVNNAVDVIVQLARGSDGTRRIVEVSVVVSRHREDYRLVPVMEFRPARLMGGADEFHGFPLPDLLVQRLLRAGEPVPEDFVAEPPEDVLGHGVP